MISNAKQYVGGKMASDILGVHQRTLYQWEKKNWIDTIRTPGRKRLYNVQKYMNSNINNNLEIDSTSIDNNDNEELDKLLLSDEKLDISYVRTTSSSQILDCEKQKKKLKSKYPNNVIIQDVGPSIDIYKKGINTIIKLAIKNKINKLVITHKSRLSSNYEFISYLISECSQGETIVLNKIDKEDSNDEFKKDMELIVNNYISTKN
jgi:predicted site-specific integrase-resolvase